MTPMLIGLFVALLVVGLLAGSARIKRSDIRADVYRPQEQLFSAAEVHFLAALDQSIEPEHRVFGKVRLADLVSIKSGLSPSRRQIALNRVAQKHIDFVVCAGASLTPICAIELNDSSHKSSHAMRRDDFVASVCAQVGIPLVVFKAAASYSKDMIRLKLASATQPMIAER